MRTKIVILILIVILYLLYTYKSPKTVEHYRNSNSGSAYVFMQIDDEGYIVVNRYRSGKWQSSLVTQTTSMNKPWKAWVRNLEQGDYIEFFYRNKGGPSGICGYIRSGQDNSDYKYYPTNGVNFTCSGFLKDGGVQFDRNKKVSPFVSLKHLGFYRDNHTYGRDINKLMSWSPTSIEDCARKGKYNYYNYIGSQYNGECWAGDSYGKYGSKSSGFMKNKGVASSANQLTGGSWGNSVFEFGKTRIREYDDYHWGRNGKARGMHSASKWIGPDLGHRDSFTAANAWWCMRWDFKVDQKQSYCPNDNYVEYNPLGCWWDVNNWYCRRTPRKNFKANMALCRTPIKTAYSRRNYTNLQFFSLIQQALANYRSKDDLFSRGNKYEQQRRSVYKGLFTWKWNIFYNLLRKFIRLSCKILEIERNPLSKWNNHPDKILDALVKATKNNYIFTNLLEKTGNMYKLHSDGKAIYRTWEQDVINLVKATKRVALAPGIENDCPCKRKMISSGDFWDKAVLKCAPC